MADKVFMYLMITISISLLLWMSGLGAENNSITLILDIIQGDFSNTELWIKMAIILGAAALAVASVGLVVGNSGAAITAASIAMAFFFVSYISDIIGIITSIGKTCDEFSGGLCSISYWLLVFILAPIAAGFGYSLFRFAIGGND